MVIHTNLCHGHCIHALISCVSCVCLVQTHGSYIYKQDSMYSRDFPPCKDFVLVPNCWSTVGPQCTHGIFRHANILSSFQTFGPQLVHNVLTGFSSMQTCCLCSKLLVHLPILAVAGHFIGESKNYDYLMKCSSPARNAFVFITKGVHCQNNKHIHVVYILKLVSKCSRLDCHFSIYLSDSAGSCCDFAQSILKRRIQWSTDQLIIQTQSRLTKNIKIQYMAFWRQHPAGRNPLVSRLPLQRLPGGNRSSLAPCEVLNPPNSFSRVRRFLWSESRLFLRRMCRRSLFLLAVSTAA